MALGQNLGYERMALASEFTAKQLSDIADWHIRDETLLKAMAELDNFVLRHPYSKHWGDARKRLRRNLKAQHQLSHLNDRNSR